MSFTPPSILTPGVQGVCVQYDDWNNLATFLLDQAGFAIAMGQGLPDGNAIPQSSCNPVTCVPGTGLQVKAGGTSGNPQWALIAGILAASIAKSTFTVPGNSSGNTRYDAVCVQQLLVQVSTVPRNVEGSGTQQVPYDISGMQFEYVEGGTNPDGPNPPSGYQVFAIITVPNGASGITTGDIAVQFPTMNPTGPEGPQGPAGAGITSITSDVVIPNIGQTVNMPVADPTAYPIGANGIVIGANQTHAMYFVVTNISGDVLTVMNTSASDFYNNNGTLTNGGLVIPCSAPPNTFLTSNVSIPNVGDPATLAVNTIDEWNVKQCGVVFGPNNSAQSFAFVVTGLGAGTIAVTCVGVLLGAPGGVIKAGGFLFPTAPLTIEYQNGDQINGPVLKQSGEAHCTGGQAAVSLPVAYADATYRISKCELGNFTAWVVESTKTATGFTISISQSTGSVDWEVTGPLPT